MGPESSDNFAGGGYFLLVPVEMNVDISEGFGLAIRGSAHSEQSENGREACQ